MTTSQRIRRARDVEEGTFVRVLDDVPNSELTIGDEGLVVDRPEGKFLLTEELDEPLLLGNLTPVEIISAVREPRAVTLDAGPTTRPVIGPPPRTEAVDFGPTTEEEFPPEEQRALTLDEEAELEDLTEMDANGDEMEEEEERTLVRLGERLRRFGRAAGQAFGGAVELGAAVGAPTARGIVRGVQALQRPEVRQRIREGLITGARETGRFVGERVEVPIAAAEFGLRGVAAVETGTARLIRQLTGQQVRLSRVPAGTLVRFEEDLPEQDIFRGDEGVVQFGIRRRQRRVFFPSTGETVLADPNILVTVLGQRRATDAERLTSGRRLLQRPEARRDFDDRFFTPRRPTGVTPAPESFRPRVTSRAIPAEVEFMGSPPPAATTIFPDIRVFGP